MKYEITMKAARKMYRLAKKQLANPPSLRVFVRREYVPSQNMSPKLVQICAQGSRSKRS